MSAPAGERGGFGRGRGGDRRGPRRGPRRGARKDEEKEWLVSLSRTLPVLYGTTVANEGMYECE